MQQVNLPSAHEAVGERLHTVLDAYPVSAAAVDTVRDRVEGYKHDTLDYAEYAAAFAYRYGLTNYVKAAAVLEAEPPTPGAVADLGSGPGTATLAYLTWLDRTGADEATATLVDESPDQHAQASHLLDAFTFPGIDVAVERYVADIRNYVGEADTAILSHVLTEQPDDAANLLQHARSLARDDCYVIERVDDPLWDDLDIDPETVRVSTDVVLGTVETAYAAL